MESLNPAQNQVIAADLLFYLFLDIMYWVHVLGALRCVRADLVVDDEDLELDGK